MITTINTKKQSQVGILEDECPSLAVYHDSQETFHRVDSKLTTIDEKTTTMQGTLLTHTQWKAAMGHEMADFQQQQQQQQ
jgi:hypothetical protein